MNYENFLENILGNPMDEWHQTRKRLESEALLAAAALLAHTCAVGCELHGHGVSIVVKTIEMNG